MNRIWAAIALFVILIGLGFWSVFGTAAVSNAVIAQVEQLEQEIRRQDFSAAQSRWATIMEKWETDSRLFSVDLNHSWVEVVDAELASLQVRLEFQEETYALMHCSQIKEALRKVEKMEIPYPENLL